MSARNKDEGRIGRLAEVNDARAMKGGAGGGGGSGGGGEHGMRGTARSLATVLRIKMQLTVGKKGRKKNSTREKKMSSFCNKTIRAQRSNAFQLLSAERLYSQSPLLLFF